MNTGWVNEVSRALLRLKFLEERVEALENPPVVVTSTFGPVEWVGPASSTLTTTFVPPPEKRKPGRPLGSKNKNGN